MPHLLVRRLILSAETETQNDYTTRYSNVQRNFNILMVVARPDRGEDIDPLLSTRAVQQISDMMQNFQEEFAEADAYFYSLYPIATDEVNIHCESPGIDFEVARPGSWVALKEHLRLRTEKWHQDGGTGPWFDLVHFDVHGVLWNNEAHLVFPQAWGTKPSGNRLRK
jgi:hypothetical protein